MNIASPPWAKYRSYSNGPSALPVCGYRLAYINRASCERALGLHCGAFAAMRCPSLALTGRQIAFRRALKTKRPRRMPEPFSDFEDC
jgi:hypothetical protein